MYKKCNRTLMSLLAGHSCWAYFSTRQKICAIMSARSPVLIKVCLVYLVCLERLNPVEICVWAVYYRRRVVTES